MHRIGLLMLTGVMAFALCAGDAEARRMGGGRSMGRQSQMIQRQPIPARPAPAPQVQPAPRTAPPAAAPAPARNRWLGPLAGVAAGLGIGALLSHFGIGGGLGGMFGSIIVLAGLALLAFWIIRMFASRRNRDADPYGRNVYEPQTAPQPGWREPSVYNPPVAAGAAAGAGMAAGTAAAAPASAQDVPAGFDTSEFLRHAKVNFIRMQAAWDAADINDIQEFTTNEMFAELKAELLNRGAAPNRTDVVQIDAGLLGVEQHGAEYEASVRFEGLIREAEGAPAEPFVEVWNLVKPVTGSSGWLLAGIQQPGH